MRRALAKRLANPANEEKLLNMRCRCSALRLSRKISRNVQLFATVGRRWLLAAVRAAENYDDLYHPRANASLQPQVACRLLPLLRRYRLRQHRCPSCDCSALTARPRTAQNRTNGVPLIVNVGRDQYQLVPKIARCSWPISTAKPSPISSAKNAQPAIT